MSFKSALQRDLDRFYKVLNTEDFSIREVTKGALTQARAKLNPWAFKRLNEVAVNSFYKNAEYYAWHKMRVLAVDGTRIVLPNHKTIKEEFGEHSFGSNADSPRSLAIGSMLYDVLNNLTIDAALSSYSGSETDLLMEHMHKVEKGDLLLLDRFYASFWLLFLLSAKEVNFCVRLKTKSWLSVKDFVASGDAERIVEYTLPSKDWDKLSEYPIARKAKLKTRLIRVDLPSGEVEVLCTSLLDTKKYLQEEFAELYHLRWNEEEAYKLLKSRAQLESFSGKTAKAVKQDFFAKIFMMTMCAAFAHPIDEKVKAEHKADEERAHSQKINRTHALAFLQDSLIAMFLKNKIRQGIIEFDNIIERTREIIRPNRKNHRKHRQKKPPNMNYKPL